MKNQQGAQKSEQQRKIYNQILAEFISKFINDKYIKQNKMSYMNTFDRRNYHNRNNFLQRATNQQVLSIPIYQQPYESYRINPQQFHKKSSYVDLQLEKSYKLIENIKKQLPSFSTYSMVNKSTNMGGNARSNMAKHSALIQSKYQVNRISQQPDEQVSNESFDEATTVQSSSKQYPHPLYVHQSDNFMSMMNVNRSQIVNLPLRDSFTKVSSRFSSYIEQDLQIEDQKIYCVICQQTYFLMNQADHLIKHKGKFQKKKNNQEKDQSKRQQKRNIANVQGVRQVQQIVESQQLLAEMFADIRHSNMPQFSMPKSTTFSSHFRMENSYSINIEGVKPPYNKTKQQPQQFQQSFSQQQSQSLDYANYLPNTVQTGIQVSIKSSSIKSNNKNSLSVVESKPQRTSRHNKQTQGVNVLKSNKTDNILIELDNYELSSKGSSSKLSGSFAAFSQEHIINHNLIKTSHNNIQPQSIMNFDSRINFDNQSQVYRKSAKSLQCTYGKTFLQVEHLSGSSVNKDYSISQKGRKNISKKSSHNGIDEIKQKSLRSNQSSQSRRFEESNKSDTTKKHMEITPYFKQIPSHEPPTVKQLPFHNQVIKLGSRMTGKIQKVLKPSCQSQSVMSMSDTSIRHEDEYKSVKQSRSITQQDCKSQMNVNKSSQRIFGQGQKSQKLRSQVSPFMKSSKPRVHEVGFQNSLKSERQNKHQEQSRKATVSSKANQSLKNDDYMGLGSRKYSESGRSKKAKNIFAQSQKGQRKKE